MNPRLRQLADAGVSIWLDDLSRNRLKSGNLAKLIAEDSVTGVTTNPTIFAQALSGSTDYSEEIASLSGVGTPEVLRHLWATDVRDACRLFSAVFQESGEHDGFVSIEVEPSLAHDAEGTVAQAHELWDRISEPNVLIKIPATTEGVTAIEEAIASGISVNATLIFSARCHAAVMEAYVRGLERAAASGLDLSRIHSVASVFISRVDSEVDARLEALGREDLRGRAGVANALTVFDQYERFFSSSRFAALAAIGANRQRPLWASTGTKNPDYPDTLYVSDLVAEGVVNTMPEKTLRAFADHGEVHPTIEGRGVQGAVVLGEIDRAGVDLSEVFSLLEENGVKSFLTSWDDLVSSLESSMDHSLGRA